MQTDNLGDEPKQIMKILSIPIKQSRLSFDKGKVKDWDMNSFKSDRIEESKNKQTSNEPNYFKHNITKRSRINSEKLSRREMNEMDSSVILKEMTKRDNKHKSSRFKIQKENDDFEFFMNKF